MLLLLLTSYESDRLLASSWSEGDPSSAALLRLITGHGSANASRSPPNAGVPPDWQILRGSELPLRESRPLSCAKSVYEKVVGLA